MNERPVAQPNSVSIEISADPIDVSRLGRFVSDPGAGAVVVFTGTVRDHSPGRVDVSRLEYEAYGEVAVPKVAEIVQEANERWQILKVAVVHRIGSLDIGEAAVCVAVSSAHRTDSFDACRYIIDELKSRVPIWKKEHWSGGAEWVEEGR